MRIFVIGATGYLGRHLVRHLVAAGHEVSGSSRTAEGDAIVAEAGGAPLRGDLTEIGPILDAAAAHDATIYAAQLLLEPEQAAVRALVERLSERGGTFVFTSGTGLLAQRTDGAWSEDSFAEDDPFVPSRYLGARLVTEMLVRAAGWTGRLRAMVVRPSMIWGHGGTGHLAMFYRAARAHGSVGYLGAGLNLYSNVHVDDLAELYRLALERGAPGALYHAVSGEVNNRTMAEAVACDLGLPARSLDMDAGVARWGKFGALIGMAVCSRSRAPRSRRELGWEPTRLDLMADIGHPAYRLLADAPLP